MTITQRVERLKDMMDQMLQLEERSLQIHADTRTQLVEQPQYFDALLAEQQAGLAELREYFEANVGQSSRAARGLEEDSPALGSVGSKARLD